MTNKSKRLARSPGGKVVPFHRHPDTRARLMAVAQALFAEHGYRATSLREIAGKIGIRAPSLLHHFRSKEQLYLAVLDHTFEGLEDAARSVLMGPGSFEQRMRKALAGAIDFVAHRPDFVRIIGKEMVEEDGVGRQMLKRRIPPLFSMAQNFIFQGQRDGEFRREVDPFHFLLSLNSIILGYFNQAANVRRLWNVNLMATQTIELRKREVLDMVERTLFVRRDRA